MWKKHIETVITRRNTINGKIYREDPVIMCMYGDNCILQRKKMLHGNTNKTYLH